MHRHWPSRSGGRSARDVARGSAGLSNVFTVSIGIAMRKPGVGLESLMLEADRHLYSAKREGRDRVVHSFSGVA